MDRYRFDADADPDLAFHFDADADPDPTLGVHKGYKVQCVQCFDRIL